MRSRARSSGPSRSTKRARPLTRASPAPWRETTPPCSRRQTEAQSLRRVGQRQRLGQAAGLVEFDIDRIVAVVERREPARAVMDAFVGADRDRPTRQRARASSAPAGRGCSTSETPAIAQTERLVKVSGRQDSFASTIRADSGAAARTAARRAASPSPSKLHFQHRAVGGSFAAACAISSGVADREREGCHDGEIRPSPADCKGGTPHSLASRSQSAQSSALRGAPAGRRLFARRRGRRLPRWSRTLFDRRDDAFDALAITRIGHAFAPATATVSIKSQTRPRPRSWRRAKSQTGQRSGRRRWIIFGSTRSPAPALRTARWRRLVRRRAC